MSKNQTRIIHSTMAKRNDGFSLIELCISLSIAIIVLGFAIVNLSGMRKGIDSYKCMHSIVDLLRNARESAMAQRRRIDVLFEDDNKISLVRHNLTGVESETLPQNIILVDGYRFMLFNIPDTPDNLGKTNPICFQDTETISFLPDGSLVGDDNGPRSGTIFLGQQGKPDTASAITIIGATGRIRSYRWNRSEWIQ
jgi:type II secretory pathway pseudopilin PulG